MYPSEESISIHSEPIPFSVLIMFSNYFKWNSPSLLNAENQIFLKKQKPNSYIRNNISVVYLFILASAVPGSQ